MGCAIASVPPLLLPVSVFAANTQRPIQRPIRVVSQMPVVLGSTSETPLWDDNQPNAWATDADLHIETYRQAEVLPVPEIHPVSLVLRGLAAPTAADPKPSVDFQTRALPVAFNVARYDLAGFRNDRAALLQNIGRRGRGGTPAQKMDLAEFYLAHVMIPEGRSILSAVPPLDDLSKEDRTRFFALSMAFDVMSGKAVTDSGPEIPLVPGFENWPEYSLWVALNNIQLGDDAGIKRHLEAGYHRLETYPDPFIQANLPVMLEAAIETDQMRLAKDIIEKFDGYSELRNGSAHRFLIGLAAERAGQGEEAFGAYAQAAEGWNVYSQRARMAIVEIGLQSGALPLGDARKMLEVNRNAWRGDKYELESLIRLAAVNMNMHDSPAALDVLGDVITLFPESEEADLARQYARGLLDSYYESGRTRVISLSEFIATHRMIQSEYRFFAGFENHSEVFADHLLAMGATVAAAAEYKNMLKYLTVAHDLKLWPIENLVFQRLKLKQAQALAEGGQLPQARVALQGTQIHEADPLWDQYSALSARVFAETGNHEGVLTTDVSEPDADHLRLLAQAYWSKADWPEAARRYRQLWQEYPNAFVFGDAVNLLLAAYRSGDHEMALKVARRVPELTETPQWSEIASGLLYDPASLSTLTKRSARLRMSSAAETLEQLRRTNSN